MTSANVFTANPRISDIQNEPCKMLLPIEGYEDIPLLPLNMSVKSLENIVPHIARNAWITKERTDETPSDGLSQEESASIHLYTMEWKPSNHSLYLSLNAALRAEDRDLLIPYFYYLKLILSALWKLQSVRKTVWRGIKADLSSQYSVGKKFVWWGFSSCTESLTLLESEKFLGTTGTRTLFNIECESGKEIERHSYFQNENELLILPGTQFEVRGKINPAPGLYIVNLKETKPPFPLLQPPFAQSITVNTSATPNTNHKSSSKASFTLDHLHTVPAKPLQSIAAKPQQTLTNPTEPYRNEKLETLIQQKATLHFAEFRERQLNDDDMYLVANALANNIHWKTLSLAENNIRAVGVAHLSIAVQSNSFLMDLRLEKNHLGDGVIHLASALKVNRGVEVLYLGENEISDAGAIELADMLKVNSYIKNIRLDGNKIGDSGTVALVAALKVNTTLTNLNLRENRITDRSVDSIVDTLTQNRTLNYVHLEYNLFSADGGATLSQVTKKSYACVYL